ncbi:Uncharacterised protein [Proteus mirabilis]|uniref:Uncharacterized protein n=1 Tax=Proteus mirabilis TaxID=584 RepID=A0A379FHF8_PROMI|nr:Uncharacterised protein [Proteus mirabilis]
MKQAAVFISWRYGLSFYRFPFFFTTIDKQTIHLSKVVKC